MCSLDLDKCEILPTINLVPTICQPSCSKNPTLFGANCKNDKISFHKALAAAFFPKEQLKFCRMGATANAKLFFLQKPTSSSFVSNFRLRPFCTPFGFAPFGGSKVNSVLTAFESLAGSENLRSTSLFSLYFASAHLKPQVPRPTFKSQFGVCSRLRVFASQFSGRNYQTRIVGLFCLRDWCA